MIDSYLELAFEKFFGIRTEPLFTRFAGYYRALVVETNDPLVLHRVRIKVPELHDFNLDPQDCPWAVPSPDLGCFRAGHWTHPCIGDWVWVTFEKNHPYAPIWVGFASPTRRKMYPMPAAYQQSPVPVNDTGDTLPNPPSDFNQEYLPQDGRPMSTGTVDRYGNIDLFSAVGYFPASHDQQPAPAGFDALQNNAFTGGSQPPAVNDPDVKVVARITKYGHILAMGDQGYYWQGQGNNQQERPVPGDTGEFTGDPDQDEEFESARWLYLQRLLNEDETSTHDQRNWLALTRYGNKFEMRDTGWAQSGPIPSKSRPGEYLDEGRTLSTEMVNDFRWIKLRTKGGWLLQACDKGFDPQNDLFIQRLLIDEVGDKTEQEGKWWGNKDARWWRLIGRHGFKFVCDERGTDPIDAFGKESPRGNGFLIKGRRSPGAGNNAAGANGDPRGFFWEFNEQDTANHTTWGTPLGAVVELNDNLEYISVCTRLKDFAAPWRNIEENEFLLESTRLRQAELNTHHLVLDLENEWIRLKSRAGRGDGPDMEVNFTTLGENDIQQGLEIHDGAKGDGPWVELVDCSHRGFWFSDNLGLGIWRARKDKKMMVWVDETNNNIVIYNKEAGGKIQLVSAGNVEIISGGDLAVQANNLTFKAQNKLNFNIGSTRMTMDGKTLKTTASIEAMQVTKNKPGGDKVDDVQEPDPPATMEPSDRGKTYNQAMPTPQNDIEHQIGE